MVSNKNPEPPPLFVRLAGHDLRWQLLRELAGGDRRVRELVHAIDQPQSLVSYHLGKLRSAGLVTVTRSSADGRDVYYHLDLPTCSKLLSSTATALHPALAFDVCRGFDGASGGRDDDELVRVLFLCTGNSARSPMAAALLRHRTGGRVESVSAGSHPKPLHPHAARALRDYGIDLGGHHPQHFDAFTGDRFDFVISLCDRVREVCPEFPRHPSYIHWSIADPAAQSSGGGGYAAYRRTAAELDTRIRFLIPTLTGSRQSKEAS